MSNVFEFKPRAVVPEPEKPVMAATKAPRPPKGERPATGAEIEQGVFHRLETGRFAGLLPRVEEGMSPIEAFIAACQFYAIGGQDNGANAKMALHKFHTMIQNAQPDGVA